MFRELDLERKARSVLGVSSDAGDKKVKKAYWRMAMELHPDRDLEDKSLEDKFKVVSEAYEILTSGKNISSCTLLSCDIGWLDLECPQSYEDWWKEAYANFIW